MYVYQRKGQRGGRGGGDLSALWPHNQSTYLMIDFLLSSSTVWLSTCRLLLLMKKVALSTTKSCQARLERSL